MMQDAPARRTYRYPLQSRLSWLGVLILSIAFLGAAISFQFSDRTDLVQRGQLLIFSAVFAALTVHAFGAVRDMRRPLELHRDGVVVGDGVVPWSEVRSVDIHPLLQRMIAYDATGRRLLRVRPELEAFSDVQRYIIEHMNPMVAEPPTDVPLLQPIAGAFPALLLALMALWFGPRQSGVPALLFGGIALLLVVVTRSRRRTLRLERDHLLLRERRRTTLVRYADISAVRIQVEQHGHGAGATVVVVERATGGAVGVAGFRSGWHGGYLAVRSAWLAARAREEAI